MTTIRLGHSVFQKEQKICELENALSELQSSYKRLQEETCSMATDYKQMETQLSNYKQTIELQSLEIINKTDLVSKLEKKNATLSKDNNELQKENRDLKELNHKLSENLDENDKKIILAMDLETRLRQEMALLETRNEKMEISMEELKKTVLNKKENIEILEKSIAQKEKFNAILVKEKERLMRNSPFEGLIKEKNEEKIQKKLFSGKENIIFKKKNQSNSNEEESCLFYKNKLKEVETELAKSKKENFELTIRLKNKKNY